MTTTLFDYTLLRNEVPCLTVEKDFQDFSILRRGPVFRLHGLPEALKVPEEEKALLPVTVSEVIQWQEQDPYCWAMMS